METLIVASIYLTPPVGRMPVRHAVIGGLAASSVWEIIATLLRIGAQVIAEFERLESV